MPMKASGPTTLREIDRFDDGVGWIAHPDETMQRASHALVGEDGLWVIDPVDAEGLDEMLSEFGSVAGVAVCLDRHKRDAAAIARRHGVAVYVPSWMDGVATELNAPVERFEDELGDSGYEAFPIRDSKVPPWQEVGLWNPEHATLVVPESVGTSAYFLADGERLGVHPMLRLFPPRESLSGYRPARVLVGHGEGVLDDATIALRDALSDSRSKAPSLYVKSIQELLTG